MSQARIAAAILKTFSQKIDSLPLAKAAHFSLRFYRVQGQNRYFKYLKKYVADRQAYLQKLAVMADQPQAQVSAAKEILSSRPHFSQAQRRRRKYYQRHPRVLYNEELIETLFQLKSLASWPAGSEQIIQYCRFQDFSYFFSQSSLEDNNYFAANLVYYLKYLKLADLETKFIRAWKKYYLRSRAEEDYQYWNKIYGLTHIIFAASYYYQRLVPAAKFQWVFNYFDKNLTEILKRAHLDIICEVGLCYKLAGQSKNQNYLKISQIIKEQFDFKRGYFILRPEVKDYDKFYRCAHTNIIAYLILKKFDRLYPGPKLNINSQA